MTASNLHDGQGLADQWSEILQKSRGVKLDTIDESGPVHPIKLLSEISNHLEHQGAEREGRIFAQVSEICLTSPDYGGLGLSRDGPVTEDNVQEIGFLLSAWLESLNSDDRNRTASGSADGTTQETGPPDRPPMNLTEKIFAVHDVDGKGYVKAGETIRVSIDWIMASEASWAGMEQTYDQLGRPGIFRNDRFWLAGDHVVDPRVNDNPAIRRLIASSEKARKVFKMTEYQGMNYTIMHTEFFRERAQPGMLVIGSDSHTCSSGALGCLAVGLGAADVTMGLVTGEIWFRVPEVVCVEFVGRPPGRGVGGKDVILYVLQQLRRNTVAADRVVEYTGPGLAYLSPDARFAIANMTTEFGGITGIFVPDHITKSFIDGRKVARHKSVSRYFRPDKARDTSIYAESHTIDLSQVTSFVARYPNPDDVVPVAEVEGLPLDGCFIGACTTAEEDLILGALVLEQGMKAGLRHVSAVRGGGDAETGDRGKKAKRKVVPGSRPILDMLRRTGLARIYEDAGFEVGIPGCSYCVGMSADRAGKGEVWLSSQNRNFENRMGPGSIGHLASAATVAASSFEMKVTNPQHLIDRIPPERWEAMKGRASLHESVPGLEPEWVEPAERAGKGHDSEPTVADRDVEQPSEQQVQGEDEVVNEKRMIQGKIQRLGDFIDTDALAPAQFLIASRTNEEMGSHCLELTNPGFRARVRDGFDVVVAGKAFGCGSSREQAVTALLGCGVKCVIAESFAFIYSRNQPSLGLLGITMGDNPAFFAAAADGAAIEIDLGRNTIRIGDPGRREFPFQLSAMEKELMALGGITPAFLKFGKRLFNALCGSGQAAARPVGGNGKGRDEEIGGVGGAGHQKKGLQW